MYNVNRQNHGYVINVINDLHHSLTFFHNAGWCSSDVIYLAVYYQLLIVIMTYKPLENLKGHVSNKPPMVVFVVCLFLFAVAMVSLGLYIKDHDVQNYDISEVCTKTIQVDLGWGKAIEGIFMMWSGKTCHMVQNIKFELLTINESLNCPLFRTFYLGLLWYRYQKLLMFKDCQK